MSGYKFSRSAIPNSCHRACRDNQPKIAMQHLARMGFAAQNAAIESCQLAAMAKKAIDSEKNRK